MADPFPSSPPFVPSQTVTFDPPPAIPLLILAEEKFGIRSLLSLAPLDMRLKFQLVCNKAMDFKNKNLFASIRTSTAFCGLMYNGKKQCFEQNEAPKSFELYFYY